MKKGCWTCGEPHYHRNCPVEKVRTSGSAGPTTVGDMSKAHRIHAAVNNLQEEHQSTVLVMTGTIADQTLSVLIDPGATESFISSAALKRIKVMAVEDGSWELFEEWLRERTRAYGSAGPTTVGDFCKAHQIHGVVNNC